MDAFRVHGGRRSNAKYESIRQRGFTSLMIRDPVRHVQVLLVRLEAGFYTQFLRRRRTHKFSPADEHSALHHCTCSDTRTRLHFSVSAKRIAGGSSRLPNLFTRYHGLDLKHFFSLSIDNAQRGPQ